MINNKTRIISFLMAFLLIFTFAFINPLTVVKSYAAAPVVLTVAAQRIIAGVLVSSGIVIKGVSDLSDTQKQDMINDLTSYVWWTMSMIEKATILSLEIIDNVVSVPIEIYDMIKSKLQKSTVPDTFAPTLESQGIVTKYSKIVSDSGLPDLSFNIYEGDFGDSTVSYDTKEYDLEEANPFFVYEGAEGATALSLDSITTNIFNYENSYENVEVSTDSRYIYCSPDLSSYSLSSSIEFWYKPYTSSNGYLILRTRDQQNIFINFTGRLNQIDNVNLFDKTLKFYFIKSNVLDGQIGVLVDFYDLEGNLFKQYVLPAILNSSNVFNTKALENLSTTITPDIEFEVESNPAPVITNEDATANVLTLPTELVDTVGLTSTDVNVGTTTDIGTGEGTGTNTETTGLLQKILDTLMALGDYILEGIKNIFMPDLDGIILLKEAIEEKFAIIGELKEMIDDLLDILTNDNPEPPNIIIPLSKAEGNIDYGQDCIALDLSWYGRYKEVVDLFIIGFAYVFFIWRLYQRLPGIVSGSDGINWGALSGKSEYSGSGNIGFKPGGGKK